MERKVIILCIPPFEFFLFSIGEKRRVDAINRMKDKEKRQKEELNTFLKDHGHLMGAQEDALLSNITLPIEDGQAKPSIDDDPQTIEQYIFDQLQKGDQKASDGPSSFSMAAMHYFNALSMYPMFYELYMLFAQKLHPMIFKTLQAMIAQTTSKKKAAYFPTLLGSCKRADIDVIETGNHKSSMIAKDRLNPSLLVLEEEPLIAFLRPDIDREVYCNYCFAALEDLESIEMDSLGTHYCSKECSEHAWNRYQQLIAVLRKGQSPDALDSVMELAKREDMYLLWMAFRLVLLMTVSELSNPLHPETYTITEHIERLPMKQHRVARTIIEKGVPVLRDVFRGPYDKLGESRFR